MKRISKVQVDENIKLFKELEVFALSRIEYYFKLEHRTKENEILRKWFNLANRFYAIFRRDISDYLAKSINEDILEEQQYYDIASIKTSRIFFDCINSFEYISELLRLNSSSVQEKLQSCIKNEIEAIDCIKNEKIKQSIKESLEMKIKQQHLKRKVFSGLKLIDKNEESFLKTCWELRNSMHQNFVAYKKIRHENSHDSIKIKFSNGQLIGIHPKMLMNIIEKISEISIKIISKTKDLNRTNVRDL